MAGAPPVDRMRDHWWWRPGWRVGRGYYTWHLTFDRAPDLHRLAEESAAALRVPGLDVIPVRWLHLTMQGVGFADEVSTADADAIVHAARRRLADVEPFEVVVSPGVVVPEAVGTTVEPAGSVARVRSAIRAAIADVWGADRVPGTEAGFVPHVSLAYSASDGPAAPIVAAVNSVRVEPARATIGEAQLIVLDRDHRQYRWTTYAVAPLGRGQRGGPDPAGRP